MKTFAAALIACLANAAEWGYQPSYNYQPAQYSAAASKSNYGAYGGRSASDFDAYGRDQDLSIKESYGKTSAKAYGAESYDEWDNKDNDRYGAQAWGKDRDVYGASSYGKAASADKYGYAGQNYGNTGYGHGYGNNHYGANYGAKAAGASQEYGAAKAGYDNDEWAKQSYGQDFDSRYGKSYDSVTAKSYDNENYAKEVQADDDVWAQDYDTYNNYDKAGYGKAASAYNNGKTGYGNYGGWGGYGGYGQNAAASKSYGAGYGASNARDFDAYARDQDYKEKVSYDNTRAKSYAAESYDEWDNKDDDRYGAQAWGQDRDAYGASSYGKAASAGKYGYANKDYDNYGGYGGYGHGHGYGGYGGYGKSYGGYGKSYDAAAAGRAAGASKSYGASAGAYDNDVWAKQAYGQDTDSRWGKSYDSVDAKSYDNEQYAREVQADDDVWAVDYDQYNNYDKAGYGKAASAYNYQPARKSYSYQPKSYGYSAYQPKSYSYGGYKW